MAAYDEKKRPTALKLGATRSNSSDSSSSDNSSLKVPRTPRFAEATSVHSPVESRSPFADPNDSDGSDAKPGDVGFGYISKQEVTAPPMTPKTPLKSAMKAPGTPGRAMTNPLSPTFNEEERLEKREAKTDKQQARDLKIKTRVRMAKFALRGVNFSCSLIILAMLSSSFAIFNATRTLPDHGNFTAWDGDSKSWPQKLVLAMACVSLLACIIVFIAYCRGGHRRAEKVATYYTMFAIGWFIFSMILWVITAAIFQHSKNSGNGKDMWGWSCLNNAREKSYHGEVDYALVCRLQNWTLICIIIEIVVEVICVALYAIVFYRYYSKRKLSKSMDMRDRARSDLYLAQLRTQSAPNTPGFGPKTPMSPALSQYAMSPRHPPAAYRNLADIEEGSVAGGSPMSEPPKSQFVRPQADFKLQAPPTKAPSATPKLGQGSFTHSAPSVQVTAPAASDEPTYDAVPIPGAYADQAVKSPPPNQTSFGHAR